MKCKMHFPESRVFHTPLEEVFGNPAPTGCRGVRGWRGELVGRGRVGDLSYLDAPANSHRAETCGLSPPGPAGTRRPEMALFLFFFIVIFQIRMISSRKAEG